MGVIETIKRLPNLQAIAGNTERYVLTGDRPYPSLETLLWTPDRSAGCILDVHTTHHELIPRVVAYDHDVVLARISEVQHPASAFLRRFQIVG